MRIEGGVKILTPAEARAIGENIDADEELLIFSEDEDGNPLSMSTCIRGSFSVVSNT